MALISRPAFAGGRADGSYLHRVSRTYETPHLDWAKRLSGGPIRTLMIAPRNLAAREIVELAQRVDLNYEAVATHSAIALANEGVYEATVTGTSTHEKTREILGKLDQRYEAIVLANVDFKILPPEAQFKILEQVAAGTGLLMVYPRPLENEKLLASPTEDWKQILKMVDVTTLPGDAPKGAAKLLRTYQFGKGRIATVTYPGVTPTALSGGPALTAFEEYSPGGWQARYENNMAFAGRALQWTAGRSLAATAMLTLPPEIKPAQDIPVSFQIAEGQGLTLGVRLRDQRNTLIWDGDLVVENGRSSVSLPGVPAGTYYLDATLGKDDKTESFGVFRFDVGSPVGAVKISTDKQSYESGEPMEVNVALDQALTAPAQIRMEVRDLPNGKLWHQEQLTVAQGQKDGKLRVANVVVPTVAGIVRCEIWQAGKKIATAEKITYFPRRRREIFPTLLWGSTPPYMSANYSAQIMANVNDPVGVTHPEAGGKMGRLAALFNQRFAPYTTRIGLNAGPNGETLSASWLGMSKEEVEQATGGDGSFYNPAVKAFWKKNVERRVQGLPEVGPMVYTLGDENSFSYDAGYSKADDAAFKEYLRGRYGSIEKLNQEWGTTYATFDVVEHLRPEELRKQRKYPAWYDQRRFMEKQYADVHHYLAECIKAIDPQARVGAEGSVPGELEQTVSKLDFWGPYSDSVLDEVLRSIAPEKLRTLWWGFGPTAVNKKPWRLWRPLLQGTVNGNAWYTSGLEAFGLLGIDFDVAKYYREIQDDIRALDRGQAQMLIDSPLKQDGIAILWSHASYSASFMDERFFKPTDSSNTFMSACYRSGLNFDYVTSKMVAGGALNRYKVLCLFGASALSAEEQQAIEAFVRRGGVVIADINPGILNEYCRPLPASRLGALFGTPGLNSQNPLELRPVNVQREVRGRKLTFQAEKAYQVVGQPLFTVREEGPGTAILLNFNLGSAASTAAAQTPMDGFVRELLAIAGVQPDLKVEGLTSDQAMIRVRQTAECQVVGVLAEKSDVGKNMTLRLPKTGWVYEINKGLLGHTSALPIKLDSPFKVFAIYEAQQTPPRLQLDSTRVSPGGSVQVNTQVLKPKSLYRLEVQGPNKETVPARAIVCSGAALKDEGRIRFAFNEVPGNYHVTLTEIGTGLHSEADVTLQKEAKL